MAQLPASFLTKKQLELSREYERKRAAEHVRKSVWHPTDFVPGPTRPPTHYVQPPVICGSCGAPRFAGWCPMCVGCRP